MNYHDYKGKSVLFVGANTFSEAACALEHGAELVETMPGSPGGESDLDKLVAWPGRTDWASEGKVQIRNVAGTTLEDEDAWDDVVISGVGQADLPDVLQRAQRAVRSGGKVLVHKTAVDWDDWSGRVERPAPLVERSLSSERKVMLHVHNVRRCGGTGNFVYDMARCFGNFNHVAVCVNDPAGDKTWIQDVQNVMRTMYAPQITEALLNEINPRVVVLHATSGERLEGGWPYPWLQAGGKRFVIRLHHIPTRPILPADLSVFVSDYVRSRYQSFLGKQIDRWIVMPPCTDLAPYSKIAPRTEFSKLATTGGKACKEMQGLMAGQLSDWSWNSSPPGRIGQFAGYLSSFPFAVVWSGHQETWCRTVTEAMAAGCVVIGHRAGAIPEQIEHGKNGFLFDNGEQLVLLLRQIEREFLDGSQHELAAIADAGRKWALQNVGFPRMKSSLYEYLIEALMSA